MIVYVFDDCSRDSLLARGWTLLKSNGSIYAFALPDDETMRFSLDVPHYVSDVLTF